MLTFIVLGIILGLGIWLICFGINENIDGPVGIGLIISLFDLVGIVVCLTEIAWPRSVEYDLAKYEELKRATEQVNTLTIQEDFKDLVQSQLFNKVQEMNNYIDKNKIYVHSPWKKWFYSEKIANLEKLNYIE